MTILKEIPKEHEMKISPEKIKSMAIYGKYPIRVKRVVSDEIIEQVSR